MVQVINYAINFLHYNLAFFIYFFLKMVICVEIFLQKIGDFLKMGSVAFTIN